MPPAGVYERIERELSSFYAALGLAVIVGLAATVVAASKGDPVLGFTAIAVYLTLLSLAIARLAELVAKAYEALAEADYALAEAVREAVRER